MIAEGGVQNDKTEARALAKARRTELNMAAVGRGMAQALFSLPQWQRAGAVLAFAAMPDEPDTAEILRRALADGKRLLLPRVRSKTEMDWVEIPALCLLRPGAFGIQEPPADLPTADPAEYAAALALDPCTAASRDGVRLGRGGGYYDRFLAHYKGSGCCSAPGPAAGRAALRRLGRTLCAREYSDRERNFTMKKLLFATALLTALFLSACGAKILTATILRTNLSQDPRKARSWTRSSALTARIPVRLPSRSRTRS